MEVRREPSTAARDEIDDLRRAVHRFERADAERHVAADRQQRAQQIRERRRTREIATVGSEVDAGDRDSLNPALRDALHVRDHVGDRQAAARVHGSSG